jgi:hypothetical protein
MSEKKAETLLLDWANLPEIGPDLQNAGSGAYKHLHRLYPEVFSQEFGFDINDSEGLFEFLRLAFQFRVLLRKAWDAPDLFHQDWYMHQIQHIAHYIRTESQANKALAKVWGDSAAMFKTSETAINQITEPPLEASRIEAVVYHLRRNIHRALHCPNPDCANPYFFSTKKGQKYCSTICARPAQLESKKRWWSDYRAKLKEGKGGN